MELVDREEFCRIISNSNQFNNVDCPEWVISVLNHLDVINPWKYVLEKLSECNLLCGIYDAKNGKESFMHGVALVMELIAHHAGDEEFEDRFLQNMIASEEEAGAEPSDKPSAIDEDDICEFVGQIIDNFEDFLESKGVNIENPEKTEAVEDGEDPESICILYGSDYGDLQTRIEDVLARWELI